MHDPSDRRESDELTDLIRRLSNSAGRKILITGGATCEDIDPVRFITNRSTGIMGIAVARAALALHMQPLLLLGANAVNPPRRVPTVHFRSAADLLEKMQTAFPWCDALVMTAAVADYTPAMYADCKIHKMDGDLTLKLKRTPDILQVLSRHPARREKQICGFSLDTRMDLAEGHAKMINKKLEMLVVNTTAAFAVSQTTAVILSGDGAFPTPPGGTKYQLGKAILQKLFVERPQ